METVIVICLLIIIFLLLQDKIALKKRAEKKPMRERVNPNLPDIMGQPKPLRSLLIPNTAQENIKKLMEQETDNFDVALHEVEVEIQIPPEELDEVFNTMPDFEEEEQEWNKYGISTIDDHLAQGFTFNELSSFGALLQKENLEQAQKETAIAIVQKLQGTELFILLENSMEGASRKIAMLLESSLSETDSSSSSLRKNDLDGFDIGEFV